MEAFLQVSVTNSRQARYTVLKRSILWFASTWFVDSHEWLSKVCKEAGFQFPDRFQGRVDEMAGLAQGEETSWFYDVTYCLLLKTTSLDHLHTVGQNLKNVGTRFE